MEGGLKSLQKTWKHQEQKSFWKRVHSEERDIMMQGMVVQCAQWLFVGVLLHHRWIDDVSKFSRSTEPTYVLSYPLH
jgi:hypothetical protein